MSKKSQKQSIRTRNLLGTSQTIALGNNYPRNCSMDSSGWIALNPFWILSWEFNSKFRLDFIKEVCSLSELEYISWVDSWKYIHFLLSFDGATSCATMSRQQTRSMAASIQFLDRPKIHSQYPWINPQMNSEYNSWRIKLPEKHLEDYRNK